MSSTPEQESQWMQSVVLPKIIEKIAPKYDGSFKVIDIKINFIGAEEAFMLTTCYRAAVTFESAGETSTRHLVVKKTPELPVDIYDAINFATLFNNEIETYSVIVPALEKFTSKSMDMIRYHYVDIQRSFAAIVLEDFTTRGWRMSKDKVNLSLEHCLLAVKYLGRFHGVGFALKNENPALFESLRVNLKESRYASETPHPEYYITMKTAIDRLKKAAQQYSPKVPAEFLDRLTKLLADPYVYGKMRMTPKEPMVTLCHGDYLRNNIAFKYSTEEGKTEQPEDVIMFDMQTARFTSPMIDLTIFLALSTFAEVRQTHFEQLFRAYHDTLVKVYSTHARGPLPEHLSRESLLKEYVHYLPYSISITSCFLMTLVAPNNMTPTELLSQQRTPEQIVEEAMTRGGAVVDRELAHQTKEMYDLSVRCGVDICEGFEHLMADN